MWTVKVVARGSSSDGVKISVVLRHWYVPSTGGLMEKAVWAVSWRTWLAEHDVDRGQGHGQAAVGLSRAQLDLVGGGHAIDERRVVENCGDQDKEGQRTQCSKESTAAQPAQLVREIHWTGR